MTTQFLEMFDTPSSEAYDSQYELVSEGDKKKFVCKFRGCGKFFRYKSEIVRHTATHSESRPFICQYDNCLKAFKRNDALENHIRSSHTKETPFICPFQGCTMKFTTHGSFRYHVLKHNKQESEHEPFDFSEDTTEDFDQSLKKQAKLDFQAEDQFFTSQEAQKAALVAKKLGKDELGDEFFAPPPRFASTLKWEMVDDEVEDADLSPKIEEPQKNQLDSILEENSALKQKLTSSEKMIKGMQKQISDLMGSLYVYQSQLKNISGPNSFQGFSALQPNLLPESQFDEKVKADPFSFDLLNYGEVMSPPEPLYRAESNPFETFSSFGKDMNSFDF